MMLHRWRLPWVTLVVIQGIFSLFKLDDANSAIFFMSSIGRLSMPNRTSWNCPQALLLQIESLKRQLQRIEATVHQTVITQEDKIFELENMVNPYSASGQAICNSSLAEEDFDD